MMYAGKKLLRQIAVSAALLSLYAGAATTGQAAPVEALAFSHVITDKELDQDRGAGVPIITNQTMSELSSSVTGGTDINTISGMNAISSGALAGISGFTTVIQNSGNNVGIQSATTVNVTFINN